VSKGAACEAPQEVSYGEAIAGRYKHNGMSGTAQDVVESEKVIFTYAWSSRHQAAFDTQKSSHDRIKFARFLAKSACFSKKTLQIINPVATLRRQDW